VKILAVVSLACALMLVSLSLGNGTVAAETNAKPDSAIAVSLADLLADKQHYKDKLVRIPGFVVVARENQSLFVNEDEADTLYGDPKTGVWLNLNMAQHERFRRFSGKYGQVTGRFRTSDCEGHLCLFGGSLDQVQIRSR
jgi:hypothetical protein